MDQWHEQGQQGDAGNNLLQGTCTTGKVIAWLEGGLIIFYMYTHILVHKTSLTKFQRIGIPDHRANELEVTSKMG